MHRKKADKHILYEKSVQTPEADINFMLRVYRNIRGRKPLVLREDFCGTAALCCEWVRMVSGATAYGIDLHKPTLDWGYEKNVSQLGILKDTVELICADVLDETVHRADVAAAFNFSYFCFKKRNEMLDYCRKVYAGLNEEGLFFLDIFGGPGALTPCEDETDHGEFTYIWDQEKYNPITGEILCHIHFKQPSGRSMRKAFTYDWRLWTIPEMTDILLEAGFKDVQIYWEGTDRSTGEGNGIFRRSRRGDDSEAYVSYIVAVR